MFLGEDLLVWLVLAMGAALAVGNFLALVRPHDPEDDTELERAPVPRALLMIAVGAIAAVWAAASLISG